MVFNFFDFLITVQFQGLFRGSEGVTKKVMRVSRACIITLYQVLYLYSMSRINFQTTLVNRDVCICVYLQLLPRAVYTK